MNRKLRKHIKRALSRGKSKEKIIETLLDIGWSKETIEQVFEKLEKKPKRFMFKFVKEPKEELDKPEPEITEEPNKIGLSSKVDGLTEKMDMLIEKSKIKKGKPFKLPFKIRSQLKLLAKKDKVLVILLKTNRSIQLTTQKIKDGLININGKIHQCTTDFIYMWLGKTPCIVLPEWDLNPIGTQNYYDAIDAGRKVDAQNVIIRAIEHEAVIGSKMKLSGKMILWIVIILAIVGWVIFGGME